MTTLHDSDFWYETSLYSVSWPDVFYKTAPFLSTSEREILLDISGSDGVSPVTLLSAILLNKNDHKNDFQENLKRISGDLTTAYFNISGSNQTSEKESYATNAIWTFVRNDNQMLDDFINIYNRIKSEVDENQPSNDARSYYFHNFKNKRGLTDGSSENELGLPFPSSECWQIGPSHHSNKHCWGERCPKSSLDLSPSLYHPFGHDFGYYNSDGTVTASHAGIVYVNGPCKLTIFGKNWRTYYSHIRPTVNSGDSVNKGDSLGHIELERSRSNCNCELARGRSECATGPHIHFEVRSTSGQPVDLHGLNIGGYIIKTGSKSYDLGCAAIDGPVRERLRIG